jgi:hypothetical protein
VPTLERLEEAAASLGLPTSRKGPSLRVHIESQSALLSGVIVRMRSNGSRTTARLWWGSMPGWCYPLMVLGPLYLMGSRASLHPFNDAAKFVSVAACVAFIPAAITNLIAGRVRKKLFTRADELERRVA